MQQNYQEKLDNIRNLYEKKMENLYITNKSEENSSIKRKINEKCYV